MCSIFLYRAGVVENVRGEEEGAEFKETGELYRLSSRSPVNTLAPLPSLYSITDGRSFR